MILLASLLVELLHQGELDVVCTCTRLFAPEGVVEDREHTLSSSRVGGVGQDSAENHEEAWKSFALAHPPFLDVEAVVCFPSSIFNDALAVGWNAVTHSTVSRHRHR